MSEPRGAFDLLRCPDCRGALAGGDQAACAACGRRFTTAHGVLSLTPASLSSLTLENVGQFAASWEIFDHIAPHHRQQFIDWIAPLSPGEFRDKVVVEAGCGKGRHSLIMADWGPRRLFSLDLGEAVYQAAANTANLPAVTTVRADLQRLPLADGAADIVVCVGVLHHVEAPQSALAEFWRVLKPGGTLCLWVYGREGNGWIIHGLDPLRKAITSRIPTRMLRWLAWPLTAFLYLLLKCLYGPLSGWGARPDVPLPYGAYLSYISKFPYREIENIVVDQLCPPIALYLSREEIERWFAALPGARPRFRWHNRNSWTVRCDKPAD